MLGAAVGGGSRGLGSEATQGSGRSRCPPGSHLWLCDHRPVPRSHQALSPTPTPTPIHTTGNLGAPTWWVCAEAQSAVAGTMVRAQVLIAIPGGEWGWVCGSGTQERDLGGRLPLGVPGWARSKLTPGGHLACVLSGGKGSWEGSTQAQRVDAREAAQHPTGTVPSPAALVWTGGVAAPLSPACPLRLRLRCPHLQESAVQ